jgi:hypothetical protein
MTPAEQRVLRAAETWRDDTTSSGTRQALRDAVDAMRADRGRPSVAGDGWRDLGYATDPQPPAPQETAAR